MPHRWPEVAYAGWSAACDTLHAHTQVLGKLAATLAPPEPQLQHAALRLTARGWETLPLPAPDGSGALVVALDLHAHQALAEHSDGRVMRIPLTPDRPVADVTRDVLEAVRGLAGPVEIDPTPQEVPWSAPLDADYEHATYNPDQVASYFAAATQAALVLAAFRAPVNLFSGLAADPPSDDFIMRNSMDSQEVAIGWWPGDPRYGRAAFYAYAHPAPDGYADANLGPAATRWNAELGLYVLDWDDVRTASDPHAVALDFAHAAFHHACIVCEWEPALLASAEGTPPPVA
jgi:hypothetical protein